MSDKPFRILAVCTMNICRSPAMEQQLQVQSRIWQERGSGPIEVSSAGTQAVAGAPSCDVTLPHLGVTDWKGAASELTAELLAASDLVLTAASNHGSEILAVSPSVRSRVFTLRQAAHLASSITQGPALATAVAKTQGQQISPTYDQPHTLTEPLPRAKADRLAWLVTELDAVRGTVPVEQDDPDLDPSDIPDPHILGFELHPQAAELIESAVADLSESIQRILNVDLGSVGHHG